MTPPDVDQELERLFSVGRTATAPDAGARERIRAGLAPRLASGAAATHPAWTQRAWLGLGVAVVGAGAVALWLTHAPHANEGTVPVSVTVPIAASAAPAFEPVPPAPAPPAAPTAPAFVTPPPAPAKPAPSLEASKPTPSSTRNADPAEELSLVRAMQQALHSGNPSQALVLAAAHARRFPRGTLLEEREGVRAVAQCQLAAPSARPAVLDAFTRRFAASPYAARVRVACQ